MNMIMVETYSTKLYKVRFQMRPLPDHLLLTEIVVFNDICTYCKSIENCPRILAFYHTWPGLNNVKRK